MVAHGEAAAIASGPGNAQVQGNGAKGVVGGESYGSREVDRAWVGVARVGRFGRPVRHDGLLQLQVPAAQMDAWQLPQLRSPRAEEEIAFAWRRRQRLRPAARQACRTRDGSTGRALTAR